MNNLTPFDGHILDLNVEQEVNRITDFLRESILQTLHRRGAIVGISGGIDSSVVLALCVRALGTQRVIGILIPERESSPDSAILAQKLADQFGIATVLEDITGALDGSGCYQRRDEAVRRIFPAYGPEWKLKITLPGSLLDQETLNVFRLTVVAPDGEEMTQRLPIQEFLQIVAASNFKQRTRMAMLYYHAELRSFAVVGTPNKNEHDLGFFVKYGDGGLDVSPIVHLFKSQVYQLAKYLDIPEEIQERVPTSDTYSAGSTQEEFFFRLPFRILDTIWRGMELGYSPDEIASALNLTPEQVNRVMDDIQRKQRTTEYLRKAVLDLPYPPQD